MRNGRLSPKFPSSSELANSIAQDFETTTDILAIAEKVKSSGTVCAKVAGAICQATYDFNGRGDDELSFQAGDYIYVEKVFDDQWCEGRVVDSTRKGYFPATYVTSVPNREFTSVQPSQ